MVGHCRQGRVGGLRRRRRALVGIGEAVCLLCLLACALPGLAMASSGWTAYVANFSANSVTPLFTSTETAGTPIAVGSHPSGVTVTPDGRKVYVTNNGDNSVSEISTATNLLGVGRQVGVGPEGLATSPDGSWVYVANEGSFSTAGTTVTPIFTANNATGGDITAGHRPWAVAFTPNGRTAYVANFADGTVTRIDVATGTTGAPIPVGSDPDALAITPDGSKLYVANFNGQSVTPIATATNTAGSPITVGREPQAIAITPNGKTAYVANNLDHSVTPINIANNTTGAAIPVGNGPSGIAITPDGRTAYVTNFSGNSVTPIDIAAGASRLAIPIGSSPEAIAIVPDQAPRAAFSATTAQAGSPVSFDASASSSPVGAIARYDWSFGDGSTTSTTTPRTTHVYSTAGTRTARLTVTNTAGTSLTQVFTGQTAARHGGAGATTTRAVSVAQSPPPPLPTRPTLSTLTQSHARWRLRHARRASRRLPVGTRFSFAVDRPAKVSFTFRAKLSGRVVKGHCRAKTAKNRRHHRCQRTVFRGTLVRTAHRGRNHLGFTGRISTSRKLGPGRYKVVVVARAGRRASRSRSLSFTIVH